MTARTSTIWAAAIVAAAALALPTVASADHKAVPTDPVTAIRLEVLNYPDLQSAVDCDAPQPQTVDFRLARIHGVATVPRRPSEHWSVRTELFIGGNLTWSTLWHHQNAGPHAPPMFRFLQSDQVNFDGAVMKVRVTLTGDESGFNQTLECSWLPDLEVRERPTRPPRP